MTEKGWAPLGAEWRQKLPRSGPYDREQMLVEFARGKRVVHVGFVDEKRMDDKLERGRWLHERLLEHLFGTSGSGHVSRAGPRAVYGLG